MFAGAKEIVQIQGGNVANPRWIAMLPNPFRKPGSSAEGRFAGFLMLLPVCSLTVTSAVLRVLVRNSP